MSQFADFDFRADGYRDGYNGHPCVPPAPQFVDGRMSSEYPRQYRAGYVAGRIDRDRAQAQKQKETRND